MPIPPLPGLVPRRPGVAAAAAEPSITEVLRTLPQALSRMGAAAPRPAAGGGIDLSRVDRQLLTGFDRLGPAAKARLEAALRDQKLQEALRYWTLCEHPERVSRPSFTVQIVESGRPGLDHVELNGINDAGDSVGRWFVPGGHSRGILRRASGQVLELDMHNAMAINNAGMVVGYSVTRSAGGFDTVLPMLTDAGASTCRALGFPGPGAALGVNNEGQVIGATCPPGALLAFDKGLLFDLAGNRVLQELVMPVPFVQSTAAHGLNDARYNPYLGGLAVGSFRDNTLRWRGFSFDFTAYQAIDRPDAKSLQLRGVNNRRDIVGAEQVLDPSDPARQRHISRGLFYRCGRAFAYSELGDPATVAVSAPAFHGINHLSQVVGSFADRRGVVRAFIATPG